MAENIKNKIETDFQYLVARYAKYLVSCDEDGAWRVKKAMAIALRPNHFVIVSKRFSIIGKLS